VNSFLDRTFRLSALGTSVRTEFVGGATTFVTLAYIMIVNPKILEAAGMPFGASMVATILSAVFGTLLMGVYANRPFAIAPYMGENAFMAYTVVKVMGYSWQVALGAIFISGVLFIALTVFGVRRWLAIAIPETLKHSFGVGIGLFLAFIGLNETGIVVIGVPGAPVHIGNLAQPGVLLAMGGFVITGALMLRRVPGAMLIGIIIVTLAGIVMGVAPLPSAWASMPPSPVPVLLQLDIAGALTTGMFPVILTVFVLAFVDTLGTLIALGAKAGLLDSEGNLPEIEKPMMVDALATTAGALLGTTTTGAYIESATGIAAGARSGLASVVTAALFILALFLAPVFTIVPAFAYGPALIMVGILMMTPITRIRFDDLTESIPAFFVVALMSFTYNIGIGMTMGFVAYPVFKVLAGKAREVRLAMWVLCACCLLFFFFYPY
jgi:adenine/guanine/hypoxanthine permease